MRITAPRTIAPLLALLLSMLVGHAGCEVALVDRLLGAQEERPVAIALEDRVGEARTLLQGRLVDFGEPRHASHLLRGWSRDERWFGRETWVWAKADRSGVELLLGPQDEGRDHFLEWRCLPFRSENTPQTVRVAVNDRELAMIELPNHASVQRVLVPGSVLLAGRNRVDFEFAYAAESPKDPSLRRLAVAFDYLRLLPSDGPSIGEPVSAERPIAVDGASIRQLAGTAIVYHLFLPSRPILSFGLATNLLADVPVAQVRLRTQGGNERVLFEGQPALMGREKRHSVELSEHGGESVELTFVVPGIEDSADRSVIWTMPRIEGVEHLRPGHRWRAFDPAEVHELRNGDRFDWNVLLVSVDTLRADHLGVYGYIRPTSPRIDAFARDAVVFAEAIAHASSTLPSHASIFTSVVPALHGASFPMASPLSESATTLAEVLRGAGFATAAFHGGGQVAGEFGLAQGFQVYEDVDVPFSNAIDASQTWLVQNRAKRFFLFLHTYAVHAPYRPDPWLLDSFEGSYRGDLPDRVEIDEHLKPINQPGGLKFTFDEEDRRHVIAAYDAGIRSMDRAIGDLIKWLKQERLYDRTMIVLTSDHGEELGEHGKLGWHSHALFDELLRVPLIVKFPESRFAGAWVEGQSRSIDIAPTILDVLGVAVPAEFRGVTLLAGGEPEKTRFAVSQADRRREQPQLHSIRTERWKLVGGQLFDLLEDRAETTDVAAAHPEVVDQLARAWRGHVAADVDGSAESTSATEIRAETQKRLEALGYVE